MKKRTLRIASISIASLALVGILLAYLVTDDGPLTKPIHLQKGTDFDITLYEENNEDLGYDLSSQTITPGDEETGEEPVDGSMNPKVRNDGDFPVYVFIELTSTDETYMTVTTAADSSTSTGWYKMDVAGRNLYAYGDAHAMTVVEANGDMTTKLPVTISMKDTVEGVSIKDTKIEHPDQKVQAMAYAIDSTDVSITDPVTVWGLYNSDEAEKVTDTTGGGE